VLAFRDIFVLQIIGILQDRKYNGRLRLACDKNPASLSLREGRVTHITYGTHDNREALRLLLWRSLGEVELDPQTPPLEGHLDYAALVEDLLLTTLPPMPAACPLLEHAQVMRTGLKPAHQSAFRDHGFNILLHIKKDMYATDLYAHAPTETFWPAFLHLCSNGQVLCDYGPSLGALLQRFEKELCAILEKLLGPQASKTYQEAFAKHMRGLWPTWKNGTGFDIIYGAMPYYDWTKSQKHGLNALGTPTMTAHCHDKALAKLSPADTLLFKQLTGS
jgi:hypothetical protein